MELLINNLIRPYRFTYNISDLGSRITQLYQRNDQTLFNSQKQKIYYSYYTPINQTTDICVIYAHCNSGCRIQGLQYVQEIIKKGWNMAMFDFSGSGNSEGKYVTLGFNQTEDLKSVIEVMIKQKRNRKIILWGRSMGAATILFYMGKYGELQQEIVACVLDSPYSDLFELAKQIAKSKTGLPNFIIETLLDIANSDIKSQKYLNEQQFNLKEMNTLKETKKIKVPTLYITSVNDQFVSSAHVERLYQNTESKMKQLEYIDKQHNGMRDLDTIKICTDFMYKALIEMEKVRRSRIVWRSGVNVGGRVADMIVKKNKGKGINNETKKLYEQKNCPKFVMRKFKSSGALDDIQYINNGSKFKTGSMLNSINSSVESSFYHHANPTQNHQNHYPEDKQNNHYAITHTEQDQLDLLKRSNEQRVCLGNHKFNIYQRDSKLLTINFPNIQQIQQNSYVANEDYHQNYKQISNEINISLPKGALRGSTIKKHIQRERLKQNKNNNMILSPKQAKINFIRESTMKLSMNNHFNVNVRKCSQNLSSHRINTEEQNHVSKIISIRNTNSQIKPKLIPMALKKGKGQKTSHKSVKILNTICAMKNNNVSIEIGKCTSLKDIQHRTIKLHKR